MMNNIDWTKVLLQEKVDDDSLANYESIDFNESRDIFKSYPEIAHSMLWAEDAGINWPDDHHLVKHAAVLMQFRFDGKIGFPGGLLDHGPHETPVDGLNRELQEEINLDLTKYKVEQKHHAVSFINHKRKVLLHFYAMELTLDDIINIELNMPKAMEWGIETLGAIRVPLYMFKDRRRGFPTFLCNKFAGCAKLQLLFCLQKYNIVRRDHLDELMNSYAAYSGLKV